MTQRDLTASGHAIACQSCGDPLDGWAYTVRFGEWEHHEQWYDGAPVDHHYCQDCYNERYGREAAAYYQIDTRDERDRLWDILDAADGDLVADLGPLYMGSQPHVRVVDGDLDGCVGVLKSVPGRQMARMDIEKRDVDRGWLEATIDDSRRGMPTATTVKLKPVEETPFADLEDVPESHEDDTELREYAGGDA